MDEWKDLTMSSIGSAQQGISELARALAVDHPGSRVDKLKAAREHLSRAMKMAADAIGEAQAVEENATEKTDLNTAEADGMPVIDVGERI